MRRLDGADPVADCLAGCLAQRRRAERHGPNLGAEQPHPLDVGALAADVLLAHVDDALEPEAGTDGRDGDAVLARACLGHDAPLAEPPREQRLPERVVELVRARVQQVLALEVEPLPAANRVASVSGVGRPPKDDSSGVELRVERVVCTRLALTQLELVERGDHSLGHKAPAVGAVRQHARPPRRRARARCPSPRAPTPARSSPSTAHGSDRLDGGADVLRRQPAREHQSSAGSALPREVIGVLGLPGPVDHSRDLATLAEQDGVTTRCPFSLS